MGIGEPVEIIEVELSPDEAPKPDPTPLPEPVRTVEYAWR
jgi:hypothetical protein